MFESTWPHMLSSKELWCWLESISPSRELLYWAYYLGTLRPLNVSLVSLCPCWVSAGTLIYPHSFWLCVWLKYNLRKCSITSTYSILKDQTKVWIGSRAAPKGPRDKNRTEKAYNNYFLSATRILQIEALCIDFETLQNAYSPDSSLSGVLTVQFGNDLLFETLGDALVVSYIDGVVISLVNLCRHYRTMRLFRQKTHSDIITKYKHKYITSIN